MSSRVKSGLILIAVGITCSSLFAIADFVKWGSFNNFYFGPFQVFGTILGLLIAALGGLSILGMLRVDLERFLQSVRPSSTRVLVLMLGLSVIGVVVLLLATRWGIGTSVDSVTYIGAARNLLEGRGLTLIYWDGRATLQPLTNFPPLFPSLIAGIGLFGVNPLHGARLLNSFLFGANIFLVGYAIFKQSSKDSWAPALGAFLILTSTTILKIHFMVWSESSFIFLGFLGLLFLSMYLDNSRPLFLVLASGTIGASFLTRYVGATLVFAGALSLLLLSKKAVIGRMRDAVLFGVGSSSPMGIWVLRNVQVAGTTLNRKLLFHPISRDQVIEGLHNVSLWLLPEFLFRIRMIIMLGVITCLLALSVTWFARQRDEFKRVIERVPTFSKVLLIYLVVYPAFVIVSISFFDALTPLSDRILSPMLPGLVILILVSGGAFARSKEVLHPVRVGASLLCILFAGFYLFRGIGWITHQYGDSVGFTSQAWQQSETLELVRSLPERAPIYSNGPEAIYLLLDRPAFQLPAEVNPLTSETNENYEFEVTAMREELEKEDGVVVYFDSIDWDWYQPTEEELAEQASLELLRDTVDGAIYVWRAR